MDFTLLDLYKKINIYKNKSVFTEGHKPFQTIIDNLHFEIVDRDAPYEVENCKVING